jgi:hypothetical protein
LEQEVQEARQRREKTERLLQSTVKEVESTSEARVGYAAAAADEEARRLEELQSSSTTSLDKASRRVKRDQKREKDKFVNRLEKSIQRRHDDVITNLALAEKRQKELRVGFSGAALKRETTELGLYFGKNRQKFDVAELMQSHAAIPTTEHPLVSDDELDGFDLTAHGSDDCAADEAVHTTLRQDIATARRSLADTEPAPAASRRAPTQKAKAVSNRKPSTKQLPQRGTAAAARPSKVAAARAERRPAGRGAKVNGTSKRGSKSASAQSSVSTVKPATGSDAEPTVTQLSLLSDDGDTPTAVSPRTVDGNALLTSEAGLYETVEGTVIASPPPPADTLYDSPTNDPPETEEHGNAPPLPEDQVYTSRRVQPADLLTIPITNWFNQRARYPKLSQATRTPSSRPPQTLNGGHHRRPTHSPPPRPPTTATR